MSCKYSAFDILENLSVNHLLEEEELNDYNESIIEYMKQNVLTVHQCENLGKYFDVIPGEMRIAFWQTMAGFHDQFPIMRTNLHLTHSYICTSILEACQPHS
jgi:hypothetical protein